MTAVTAKVECTRYDTGWQDSVALTFSPDYADGRNADWAAATPALSLSMTVKADVAEHFKQGGKYTLTFTPTED
jgi:hypothetical protein